jgi:hypothetical protein
MSELLKPIRDVIHRFNQDKVLHWTEEATTAFEQIKREIEKNQMLFFPQEQGTIHVYTDASDYGIGGYVTQRIPHAGDTEYVIGYMSKALSETERRWNTIEKECYAILRTFQKFEYLLRDTQFHLYTDHRNLLFLKTPPSPKVLRWKMSIQEYNFFIHHIEGKDNVVADAFSRLVVLNEEEHPCFTTLAAETQIGMLEHKTKEDRYKDIESVHNTYVGHMGVQSTIQRLRL